MKIVNASYRIETPIDGKQMLKSIEKAGRTCYKSENRITEESAKAFVRMLIERGHESVLEHESITVRFVCDRSISHEIVRHRLASYSQESQRYVRYNGDIEFINPHMPNAKAYEAWYESCERAEATYKELLSYGVQPQQARSVLPNSTKTEIVMTANLREWRHFLKLRTATAAHPQMRELTVPLLKELQQRIPVVFDDIQLQAQNIFKKTLDTLATGGF